MLVFGVDTEDGDRVWITGPMKSNNPNSGAGGEKQHNTELRKTEGLNTHKEQLSRDDATMEKQDTGEQNLINETRRKQNRTQGMRHN